MSLIIKQDVVQEKQNISNKTMEINYIYVTKTMIFQDFKLIPSVS